MDKDSPKHQSRRDEDEERQYLIIDRVEVNNCPEEDPDGGWGWLVVLACFLTTFTLDGIGYSFGMFMGPLKSEMRGGNFGVAGVGSIQVISYKL